MKLILEKWERFVTETEEEVEAAGGITWSKLKLTIEAANEIATTQLTAERKKELLKILGAASFALAGTLATGPLAAVIAAAGTAHMIGTAVAEMFQMYAREPDVKTKNNPLLALFNLDDGFEELIDDKLEDVWVKQMMPRIEKMAQDAPDTPIDDMDKVVNLWLSKQSLKGSTGNIAAKTKTGE